MAKSRKALWGIVVFLIVLVVIRVAISVSSQPDDPKLIRQALDEAVRASREGRPGGVVELLSQNLKLNNVDVGGNQRQIADFIRTQKPDVTVQNPTPQITGDEARIVSPVELSLGLLGKRNLNEVTMIFRKEDTTQYLIFPSRRWRLVEVRAPDSAVNDLMSQ